MIPTNFLTPISANNVSTQQTDISPMKTNCKETANQNRMGRSDRFAP